LRRTPTSLRVQEEGGKRTEEGNRNKEQGVCSISLRRVADAQTSLFLAPLVPRTACSFFFPSPMAPLDQVTVGEVQRYRMTIQRAVLVPAAVSKRTQCSDQ